MSSARSLLWTLVSVLALWVRPQFAVANDLQITNLTVHPYSGGDGEVEFDISWSNSWRVTTEPYNRDAAWVFCKLRRNGGSWTHLKLKTSGHTIPSTPQAITAVMGLVDTASPHDSSTNPAVGMLMYRTNDGVGTFTANDVRLRWNYSENGASSSDVIEIRVVGIEMVRIPQGAFSAGDGPTSPSTQAFRKKLFGDESPWSIGSEDAITTTNGLTGDFYYNGGSIFTIPAAFPKGYAAFYMMKGEVSQGQWVAFFNMLTGVQKAGRDITDSTGKSSDNLVNRNNVSWTSGDATLPDQGSGATYHGVPMNYLSWSDVSAYLDWSGLRPMSELEYEKAGRGTKTAVSGEYAWGSTSITQATTVTDAGLPSERGQSGSNISCGDANGVQGPLRVGAFSKGVATREASGAGFYGVMDLSGSLWERTVTVGASTGRAFEGRYHGNGSLTTDGQADVTTWPGADGDGCGFRGGSWLLACSGAKLSYRFYAASSNGGRSLAYAGRGVRTAPAAEAD